MTNLNTAQIAQLTAMVTGGGYKRAADKDAAVRRFTNACTEKGISDPRAILATGFDAAKDQLARAINPRTPSVEKASAGALQRMTETRDKIAKRKAALKVIDKEAPSPEAKPARAKQDRATKADKPNGKRAAILEAAQRGDLPAAPDFSADTHKRFRAKLAEVVAAAEAGDLATLRAFTINPVSSSPKAIAKYRDLAVIALEARAGKVGVAA